MATDTYSGGGSTHYAAHRDRHAEEQGAVSGYHDPAGVAFLWVGWTIAFAFWAFAMTTFFGILEAISRGGPGSMRGGVDIFSGYVLMGVIGGVVVLGAAIAWGMARWATRDKRLDPLTEAATAELYDSVGRAGGDDLVSRSPDARRPVDRERNRSR